MIYLHIDFPINLFAEQMVRQKNIPCLCRVSREFEILFQEPLPIASGKVEGWDRQLLEKRAPASAGGKYTHYDFGNVTLSQTESGIYKIIDLSMFYTDFGWCPIILDGEYAPPKKLWDDDVVDDYPPLSAKKRRRLKLD